MEVYGDQETGFCANLREEPNTRQEWKHQGKQLNTRKNGDIMQSVSGYQKILALPKCVHLCRGIVIFASIHSIYRAR